MKLPTKDIVLIEEIELAKLIKPIADILDSQELLNDEYQMFNLSFWVKKDNNKDIFMDAITLRKVNKK